MFAIYISDGSGVCSPPLFFLSLPLSLPFSLSRVRCRLFSPCSAFYPGKRPAQRFAIVRRHKTIRWSCLHISDGVRMTGEEEKRWEKLTDRDNHVVAASSNVSWLRAIVRIGTTHMTKSLLMIIIVVVAFVVVVFGYCVVDGERDIDYTRYF